MSTNKLLTYAGLSLGLLALLAGLGSSCNGPRYQRHDTASSERGLVVRSSTGSDAAAGSDSTAAGGAAQLTAVRVVSPQPASAQAAAPLSATLRSTQQALVAFQVGGQVASVTRKLGDKVKAGDVLAQLDTQLFEAQRDQAAGALAQAQAQLELTLAGARPEEVAMAQSAVDSAQAVVDKAQADYDRARKLYDSGVIAKQQLDAAETGLKQAKEGLKAAQRQLEIAKQGAREEEKQLARAAVQTAQAALTQAETQLAYATLKAPFAGAVSMRQLEPGQVIGAGMPVFEVANLDQLEAETALPEGQYTNIAVGQHVQLGFPALPKVSVGGMVDSVAPRADAATRGFSVKVKLDKTPAGVLPGMVALIKLPADEKQAGLTIPRRCIVNGKVFVVESDTVHERAVQVLADQGDEVSVEGLKENEQVVLNGQEYLKDGDQVRVVDALAMDDLTTLTPHE